MSEIPGAFAVLEDGDWIPAQQSVLSMFGGEQDEFLDQWPRAGGIRGSSAHHRAPGATVTPGEVPRWPTPRSRDRQPLGATEWEITQRPPGMDLLHVRIARVCPELWVPDESLTWAQRTPALNPLFVEAIQGFPIGWTEMPLDG
jgi:hypothetical protein